MSLPTTLKTLLRREGEKSAPAWAAVDTLAQLTPSQFIEATRHDLAYLVDYLYRLLAEVQDELRVPPREVVTAWEQSLPEYGFEPDLARRISLTQRAMVAASRIVDVVDWLALYHAAAATEPGYGNDDYGAEEFLAADLYDVAGSKLVASAAVIDCLASLGRLARAHAELTLSSLVARHRPETLDGMQAAFLTRIVASALAPPLDSFPHLVGVMGPDTAMGLRGLANGVDERFLTDQLEHITRHSGTAFFGKRLTLIDPETALAARLLHLVADAIDAISADVPAQAFHKSVMTFRTLLDRQSPCKQPAGAGDYSFLAHLVSSQPDDEQWPASVPEVETLLRHLLLTVLSSNADILADRTGVMDQWMFAELGNGHICGVRMACNVSQPKTGPSERGLFARALQMHPLLTWLAFPSTLPPFGGPAMYTGSHAAAVPGALSEVLSDAEKGRRLQVVVRELDTAAKGAVAGVASVELVRALLPDVPQQALAATASMTTYLARKWVDARRARNKVPGQSKV